MKLKKNEGGRGGGGGGGLNRWVRVGERFIPFNVHKWVVNGAQKSKGLQKTKK